MNTAYDGQERVRPSGRNGNRLPLRKRGERIGGRQKGTPNKISREWKEAIIAAAANAAGRGGKPTGKGGLQGYFELVAVRDHRAFCRLLVCVMGSKKSRVRERAAERIQEVQTLLNRTVVM
jgi:hypothetical protein